MKEISNFRRGLMLVMSSPSGAGKSTLTRMLLSEDVQMKMSVSATTREPRPGEEDGEDYYFLSRKDFDNMIDNQGFLEHATVFENSYGTPRRPVEEALEDGLDIIFDIDWQGTQQLAQSPMNADLVTVFILPPSVLELENRLRNRAQDSEEIIQKRMAEAESEISHWAEYDYVLVNDDLQDTYKQLRNILHVERAKRFRQPKLMPFVRKLMNERKEKAEG
ncbi:guanylate kinase [Temperatibacter marinus]|uniref:Guanylate kinase n=1 Tax=Temperatibacter marinus TaxID=1456591 RepID=A0AA52HA45_9PROT|nr:guanylate kinase [Temperatibacter marinus]WND02345.1 guanylate kinase [Temperatibacter marinus]